MKIVIGLFVTAFLTACSSITTKNRSEELSKSTAVAASGATAKDKAVMMNFLDIFGTTRVTAEEVGKKYDSEIKKIFATEGSNQDEAEKTKEQVAAAIKKQYGFAYVHLSLVTYFAPSPGQYMTIDVVEPREVKDRMTFLPKPKGKFKDPDGLISLWDQYFSIGFELMRAEKLDYPKSCPVWHCIHGFEHPKLKPFLEKFDRLVAKNEAKLEKILKEDSRSNFRGNAAFLLAHLKNGKKVIADMIPRVADPSETVRNNVVRVLSDISFRNPQMEIPVEPIIQVLKFPMTTDRNKAAATLVGLSEKRENRQIIIDQCGRTLIEMLKLQQPNNHDFAHRILKNISGNGYGDRDYQSWENWLAGAIDR